MYIIFNKETKKVVFMNKTKPIAYTENVELAQLEEVPSINENQFLTVANVQEVTRVVSEAYTEEVIIWNEETQQEETKIVEHPIVTETYLTCDLVVNDIVITEEQKQEKYESLVEKYIRQKYTLSQELAILRQRDTKPSEFEAYNAYAEKCKAQAKLEIYGV